MRHRLFSSSALGVVLTLALASSAPALGGCDSNSPGVCPASDVVFGTEDITPEGTALGAEVQIGECISVDYVGRLADGGSQFDAGTLSFFFSGNAQLIRGFLLGIEGQQVGQTRRVTIPPSLGYGVEASDDIPSCSVLEFDITLTRINQDTRFCNG